MSRLRVVLDTNVLVSALAYPQSIPGQILAAWRQGGVDLILSRYILDEMARVLPKLARIKLIGDEIRDLADSFMFMADVVEPTGETDGRLRDSADQQIFGTWHAAKADYLITGDKDLLALADEYPIITPAEFWRRHGG